MRSHAVLAGSAALAWMLLAQPALGATVGVSTGSFGQTLGAFYAAALGETNDVSIVEEPDGAFMISDRNAAISITPRAAAECTSISPNAVRCDFRPSGGLEIEILAKDGADSVDVASSLAVVDGGPGPDTLSGTAGLMGGGPGDDRLIGRSGGQSLFGEEGADLLEGGPGRDELQGGAGTDSIAGGHGNDTVSYDDHRAPVRISLDDRANDGAAGENDWIHADVESAWGSRGPTTFIGNDSPNEFQGGSERDVVRTGAGDDFVNAGQGRDVLAGGPGHDVLLGDLGADLIRGGRGNDFLNGGSGADSLGGGRGRDHLAGGRRNDVLRGGPGRDRLSGHSGTDVLYARDRTRDRVRGGLSHDRAQVDPIDGLFSVEVLF